MKKYKIMNEENKTNISNSVKTFSKINIPQGIQQSFIKQKNSGFNLVSLKARHRLNLFKQILSKYEYKDYIRKCKNMYSISSYMNNHYSMSDLYHSERANIPDIISLFNKIDSKLNPKIMKLKKIKKSIIIDSKRGKDNISMPVTNILENNKYNKIAVKFNKSCSFDENNRNIEFNRKNIRNKTINYKIKKLHIMPLRSNIKMKTFHINDNLMNETTFQLTKNNNEKSINSVKNNMLLNSSERTPKNISFSPLLPKFKIKLKNNKIKGKNMMNMNRNNYKDMNEIKNTIKLTQIPLSTRSNYFSITHYGAIIYKNSILRKKGIENFLPNYYNLPFIYSNIRAKNK